MRKRNAGGVGEQLLVLLALVGAAAGAGAWNYQRNLALEQREVGPYGSLSTADLELLLEATEAEAEALGGAYQDARDRPPPAGDGSGRFAGFEAAQRHGRAVRELGAELSGLEASIAGMRQEVAHRKSEGDATRVFLRRLLTL